MGEVTGPRLHTQRWGQDLQPGGVTPQSATKNVRTVLPLRPLYHSTVRGSLSLSLSPLPALAESWAGRSRCASGHPQLRD